MFEGHSADTRGDFFLLVSVRGGGGVEGLACADPGVKTPIGARRNFMKFLTKYR